MSRVHTALCALGLSAMLVSGGVCAQSPSQAGQQAQKAAANAAFKASEKKLLPLTPQQIKQFRKHLGATNKAIHERSPAQLTTRTRVLRLSPGSPVPTIKIAPGYVSSIAFLDQTGAPWPITSVALGDGSAFDVEHPKIKAGNLLTITAKGHHRDSNISVTLKGWSMPVVIRLKTDPSAGQALIAMRADQRGPNAAPPQVGPAPTQVVGKTLMAFLDDVPPSGVTPQTVKGTGHARVQAWAYKKHLYVRTALEPVWPAWDNVVRGAGGVHVYRMPVVASLMLSVQGTVHTLSLKPQSRVKQVADNGRQ